jgi:membrane-associated protein
VHLESSIALELGQRWGTNWLMVHPPTLLALGFNVKELLQNVTQSMGYWSYLIIWFIVFAESGLFFGFFLPGDSLLLTTGFLCSTGSTPWNIFVMSFGCFVAAVLGDNVGYYTGRKYGRKLFEKEDSAIFKKKHLIAAQEFYDKKGAITVVAARFLAIVRTFAPIVAGAAAMNYRTFITYNIVGGLLWGAGLNLIGYYFGQILADIVGEDNLEKYLIGITIGVVLLSFIPSIYHIVESKRRKNKG